MIPRTRSQLKNSSSSHAFVVTTLCGCLLTASFTLGLTWIQSQLTHAHHSRITTIGFEPQAKPDDDHDGIRECTVTLQSGRKVTGEFIREDSLIVVVAINGIETTFQRRTVDHIEILPTNQERFTAMRSAIPDEDIEARLTLVEWLRVRQAYSLAIKELDSILIEDPVNPRAKLLHTWLSEHNKLRDRQAEQTQTPQSDDTDALSIEQSKTKKTKSQRIMKANLPPLTPEQINLIRVFEIDLRDPPSLRVPDSTIKTLMKRHPDAFSPNKTERDQVYKIPEIEKLKLLFTHKARDLYEQVEVLEDPISMKNFRNDVHSQRGWLINACSSTRCHGGTEAGRFQLISSRSNSVETVYTNFFLIENYTLDDGTPLIDYNDPERSPLLQMGMIQNNTLLPHPEIPAGYPGSGFRPIFRSTRDPKYRDAIDWIRSMYQPRPDYGIEYASEKKSTQSTQPNTKPEAPTNSTDP